MKPDPYKSVIQVQLAHYHCTTQAMLKARSGIGQAMRVKREECGMLLKTAAQKTGFSCQYVSDCERGRRAPNLDLLAFYVKL